jgi:ComF family protein
MLTFSQLIENLCAFFYPKGCPCCQNVLIRNEGPVCMNCLAHFPETNYYQQDETPLDSIFQGRIEIEKVVALFFFKKGNRIQKLLHALKYNGNQEIGVYFGEYFGKKLRENGWADDIDVILPIPLHPNKLRQRGYNQSEAIAQGLSMSLAKPCLSDGLVRKIFTSTQTKKERYNRWENVKDVFDVPNMECLKKKSILLCDDVLTTGATIEAAALRLKEIEGVKIYVATLACTM